MSDFSIPRSVRNILKKIDSKGFQAYLVGGCVRDMIMGRRIHDWDITTDATAEETMTVFRKTVPTGIKYGTVTVIASGTKAEVTTFRADGSYADSRHPEQVSFVKELKDDLSRRDFTVNAMAMDAKGQITDLFGGRNDIENKILRCVGEPEKRFSEDALRMLRAVRFSAQLGFAIEEKTEKAMAVLGENIATLSAERVLEETVKILMSPKPEAVLKAFEYGMYKGRTEKMPDIAALTRIKRMKKDKSLRLCALAYILGDGEFLKNLKADSKSIKLLSTAQTIACDTPGEIRLSIAFHGYETVLAVCEIRDVLGGKRAKTAREIMKSGTVVTREKLAVTGNDLAIAGIEEGRTMGAILRELLCYANDNPEDNIKEILVKKALSMYNNMDF